MKPFTPASRSVAVPRNDDPSTGLLLGADRRVPGNPYTQHTSVITGVTWQVAVSGRTHRVHSSPQPGLGKDEALSVALHLGTLDPDGAVDNTAQVRLAADDAATLALQYLVPQRDMECPAGPAPGSDVDMQTAANTLNRVIIEEGFKSLAVQPHDGWPLPSRADTGDAIISDVAFTATGNTTLRIGRMLGAEFVNDRLQSVFEQIHYLVLSPPEREQLITLLSSPPDQLADLPRRATVEGCALTLLAVYVTDPAAGVRLDQLKHVRAYLLSIPAVRDWREEFTGYGRVFRVARDDEEIHDSYPTLTVPVSDGVLLKYSEEVAAARTR